MPHAASSSESSHCQYTGLPTHQGLAGTYNSSYCYWSSTTLADFPGNDQVSILTQSQAAQRVAHLFSRTVLVLLLEHEWTTPKAGFRDPNMNGNDNILIFFPCQFIIDALCNSVLCSNYKQFCFVAS